MFNNIKTSVLDWPHVHQSFVPPQMLLITYHTNDLSHIIHNHNKKQHPHKVNLPILQDLQLILEVQS